MANSLWRFLNTPVHKLISLDTVDGTVDTAEALNALAETLEDENVQAIAPWVEKGAALLDVLNTPEAELAESLLPFAKIATGLLKFYLKKSQAQLTFADCVVLVCLKAYGESLKGFLPATAPGTTDETKKVEAPNTLKDFTLTDADAKTTLLYFHKSELAKHLKALMAERLEAPGFAETDAHRLTERAVWNTHRHITEAWGELPEAAQRFDRITWADWREEQEKYEALDAYLRDRIQPLPNEQIFDETKPRITFQDLYVPLDVQPLDQNGAVLSDQQPINIHTWASNILLNPTEQNQSRKVMFIQGDAGRGKSVFCRMFADWVSRELYPVFVPIFVRLRSLRVLANTLTQTLEDCPDLETVSFIRRDRGWLADENTRFLIILDGFDELLLQNRSMAGLKDFLELVTAFQFQSHHQCLLTGRPLALQGIDRLIARIQNLERVQLEPLNDELREQWFVNWQSFFGKDETTQFRTFIKACPEEIVNSLAREPLLLYLLARLHREKHLHQGMFAVTKSTSDRTARAKIQIYRESVNWVLEKQRQSENLRHSGLNDLKDLRKVLQEAALCVVQSGNKTAKLTMLKSRLKDDKNAVFQIFCKSKEFMGQSDDKTLSSLLTTFYCRPSKEDENGSVEFTHKSFGEYLFADRIIDAFTDWTEMDKRGRDFQCTKQEFYWQIYDLLGYGGLSTEILEYIFELLHDSKIDPIRLFNRLRDFYLDWCENDFLNQDKDKNFPQQKMLNLKDSTIQTGLIQVDVFAGLNVLILLFKVHANAQHPDYPDTIPNVDINFHPCRGFGSEGFESERLLKIIHYADSLASGTFVRIVGPHLAYSNLEEVYLRGVNLENAILRYANLKSAVLDNGDFEDANFSRANLEDASLINAYLSGTYLFETNLTASCLAGANLSVAYLKCAYLEYAILENANLRSACLEEAFLESTNLQGANLFDADLGEIAWDENTRWSDVRGLENTKNLPEELKQQLNIER